MTIRSELEKLRDKDRKIKAPAVVAWAAAHPNSELHSQFEWDDAKAGHQYRVWQARVLLTVHIRDEGGAPVMVSLSIDRTNGGGYRHIDDIARDASMIEIMLNDALLELRRVQAKYRAITKLAKVWREIDAIEEENRKNVVRPKRVAVG